MKKETRITLLILGICLSVVGIIFALTKDNIFYGLLAVGVILMIISAIKGKNKTK